MDDSPARSSNAADLLLVALVPLLTAGAAFAPGGAGLSGLAASVCAPVLAGLGFFPVAFALAPRRGAALGFFVIVGACAGVAIAARNAPGAFDLASVIAWICIAFGCLCGIVAPLLVLGWRALAAVVWLVVAAAACGSLLLVAGAGAIPAPLLAFNPLVRILWHGFQFDWLRAANMYPRVGTVFYAYPARSEGVLTAIVVAGIGAAAAAIMAINRRRTARQS